MSEQAKAAVEIFQSLTPEEQVEAYLEIETIWRAWANGGETRPGEFTDTGLPAATVEG